MNAWTMFRRVVLTGVSGVAAFASGAAVEPAPAGAHCGEHNWSCGFTGVYQYTHCKWVGGFGEGSYWLYDLYDFYWNDCSGTCYNGGTEGCCDSPAACANANCKPGGCGGACAYFGSYDTGGEEPCTP